MGWMKSIVLEERAPAAIVEWIPVTSLNPQLPSHVSDKREKLEMDLL